MFDVHHSSFENFLKVLLLLYLIIWITIGAAILSAVFFLAFGGVGQIISALTGPFAGALPTGLTETQNNCIISAVGQGRFDELRSGAQPTAQEQTLLQNCLS